MLIISGDAAHSGFRKKKLLEQLGAALPGCTKLETIYVYFLDLDGELEEAGLDADSQRILEVNYKDRVVGSFKADIIVENKVLVEIKAVTKLAPTHEAQIINYLKATGINVGLLVNFGDKLEFRRRVF